MCGPGAGLAVSAAAGLVSLRQDRRRPDRGGRLPWQSACSVAGAAGAYRLPARLDRDAPVRCVPDPVVLFRALSRLGNAAANSGISVLLFAVCNGREPGAGICPEARQQPALAVMGFRRGRLRRLCGNAADLRSLRGNVDGDVHPADGLPELDLRKRSGLMPASETEPGCPVPVDPVAVKMRPVDRKRLPIRGAVSPVVTTGVAPILAWRGRGVRRR